MKRQFKSPEIREAKAAILKFLKDHNLNPMKDYSKHPKYGKEFSMLLMKLTKERQKIEKIYPQLDIKNQTKHLKAIMAKKEKKAAIKAAEKELKKASLTKKESKKKPVKEAKDISSKEAKAKTKEKKERKSRVLKYDYPLVMVRRCLLIRRRSTVSSNVNLLRERIQRRSQRLLRKLKRLQ